MPRKFLKNLAKSAQIMIGTIMECLHQAPGCQIIFTDHLGNQVKHDSTFDRNDHGPMERFTIPGVISLAILFE